MGEFLIENYFAEHGGAANGSDDCSAALQAAVNDSYDLSGGKIAFPSGYSSVFSEITKDFITKEGHLQFVGRGGSNIRFVGTQYNRFNFGNLAMVSFEDLTFLGDMSGDASTSESVHRHFNLGAIQARFKNVQIYGMRAAGEAVIYSSGLLTLENCHIGGCAGAPVIRSITSMGLVVKRSSFFDYANHDGTHISKTPYGASSWINGIMGTQNDARELSSIVIDSSSFDEGPDVAIDTDGIKFINISNSSFNVHGAGIGIRAKNARSLKIDQSWLGYAGNPAKAVIAENVDLVEISNTDLANAVDKIELLGTTGKAIFTNVKRNGVSLTTGDIINTAGAVVEIS